MENKCIYGKEIAERLDQRTIEFVEECRNKGRRIPKLVCIAIGDHPASVAYMKGLRKKCEKVKVELETGTATADTRGLSAEQIRETIESLGFQCGDVSDM